MVAMFGDRCGNGATDAASPRWADRPRAWCMRIATAAALAAFGIALAASVAQAGDPLLDLVPARCHAVQLDTGPVTTSVVLTVRVSKVCEQGERVSSIRVELEALVPRASGLVWRGTGRFCVIRHVPGRCWIKVSTSSGGVEQYRVRLSYSASKGTETAQHFIDDTKPVTVAFQGFKVLISDGTTQSELYFGGPQAGQRNCLGPSPSLYGQYCADDQNGGATVTLTAGLDGALPPGDALWLTYDAPTSNDPTWGKCDKAISSTCVLATGKARPGFVQAAADVTFPAESDAHGGEAGVELVGPQGVVASAYLSIQLCQQNGNPPQTVCG